MNKKIIVMMSTYNGEKYLEDQINTIINQKNVSIDLLIRDDGSTDSTLDILKEYSKKYENIEFYTGENIKSAKSFMDLINKVENSYDYYAFADQDDIWDLDKMSLAIEKIMEQNIESNIPILYYCAVEMVNNQLEKLGIEFKSAECTQSLENTLNTFGVIKGCTMVFNKTLLKYLKEYTPKHLRMHDVYIHELCLALDGKIIADDLPHMKYRIHEENVTGKQNFIKRLGKFLNIVFTDDKCEYSNMVCEIVYNYKHKISEKNMKELARVTEYKNNIKNKFNLLKNNKGKNFLTKKEYFYMKLKIFLGIL